MLMQVLRERYLVILQSKPTISWDIVFVVFSCKNPRRKWTLCCKTKSIGAVKGHILDFNLHSCIIVNLNDTVKFRIKPRNCIAQHISYEK